MEKLKFACNMSNYFYLNFIGIAMIKMKVIYQIRDADFLNYF